MGSFPFALERKRKTDSGASGEAQRMRRAEEKAVLESIVETERGDSGMLFERERQKRQRKREKNYSREYDEEKQTGRSECVSACVQDPLTRSDLVKFSFSRQSWEEILQQDRKKKMMMVVTKERLLLQEEEDCDCEKDERCHKSHKGDPVSSELTHSKLRKEKRERQEETDRHT